MKHPTSIELMDFLKKRLPLRHTQDIEAHLSICDSCQQAFEELVAVESHLAAWEDPAVSDTFAVNAIQALLSRESSLALPPAVNQNNSWRSNLWFRRIALAAGSVAATLLIQAFVWNPLATPNTFKARINLIPEAFAYTPDQAVPDTVLILTLHSDITFSTSLLDGQYRLEDLTEELSNLVERGRFKEMLIIGTDADNPVTFRAEKLHSLMENLGIDAYTIGTGVVVLETTGELTATVTLPLQVDTFYSAMADSFDFISVDPLYSPAIDSFHSISLDSINYQVFQGTRPLEFNSPIFDYSVVKPHIYFDQISLELKTYRLGWLPTVGITPSRVRATTRAYPNAAFLADLLSPSQAVLTVDTDGNILIDRAVVPEQELERALRRLQFINPRLSLLILVREEAGPDDPGYRVMEIARRLRIRATVRKVRYP